MNYTEAYKWALELAKQWRETAETWQKLANQATALAEEATADLKKANATIRVLRQKRDDFLNEIEKLEQTIRDTTKIEDSRRVVPKGPE